MILTDPQKIIAETAQEHGVDPALALAIAETESGFDTFAARFEPGFRYLDRQAKRPRTSSPQTEGNHQATSWGMMQVMGVVARELGHKGWLTELSLPDVGAMYGVMYLKKKLDKYSSLGLNSVISAYNAGQPITGNQSYVNKVLSAKAKWERSL